MADRTVTLVDKDQAVMPTKYKDMGDGTWAWVVSTTAAGGGGASTIVDGGDVAEGAKADAEVAAAGPASVIAILKRLRTLLNGGLPAALGAHGGLIIEGVASGVAIPVTGASGGGPATIVDGGDVAQGALADAEVSGAGAASVIAILKRVRTLLNGGLPAALAANGGLKTEGVAGGVPMPVSGTFYQGTQPVSATQLPSALGQTTMAASLPVTLASNQSGLAVTGTFYQATQPISAVDGQPVNIGALADAEVSGAGAASVIAIMKRVRTLLNGGLPAALAANGGLKTEGVAGGVPMPVTGTFWQTTQPQSEVAVTTGGLVAYKLISAATTNATSVKGSAGKVYSVAAFNTNAAARYLKLYNKATSPTVGTDVPVQVYMVPATSGLTIGVPFGLAFATGIALSISTGMADADTVATGATEVVVNLGYI